MNIFLDTSSLIKLYHREQCTETLDEIFERFSVSTIFLSEITKIEFVAAIRKKTRMREIDTPTAERLISFFDADHDCFSFVTMDPDLIRSAGKLVTKYRKLGLRTLDSIQLATAARLRDQVMVFQTSDHLLSQLLTAESLPVSLIE